MTKTTEELKRAMFAALADLKGRIVINYSVKDMLRGADEFEHVLEEYLEQLRQERDELRNRLQAFQFANQSAGEFLQAKSKKLKKARKELSELRKSAGSTSAQSEKENVPESMLGPIQRICQHSFRYHHAYPSGKIESQCIFCLKIEE
jgi:histidinol-phosphate/aromatic aminotransferase/cobyric acid decarboxylase-like protein